MKQQNLAFFIFSIMLPVQIHTCYWRPKVPKAVITITPEDRIKHLELCAEQNEAKTKNGFAACCAGALIGITRLFQQNGNLERYSLSAFAFAAISGGYASWSAWSARSQRSESEQLKEEHNLVIHTDEQYLEQNAPTTKQPEQGI